MTKVGKQILTISMVIHMSRGKQRPTVTFAQKSRGTRTTELAR